jgi:hypothetical protein
LVRFSLFPLSLLTQFFLSRSAPQKRLKNETYFNPGKGAETDLTSLLTSADSDAEGEIEVLGCLEVSTPLADFAHPESSLDYHARQVGASSSRH